ncbi:MAG: type II CAAX endopeptidase family protein [Nitrososphaerota archaeon]|nr:CPBP family intramembrane metalloprotease [Aigarchaeota archaeon]MDW8077085.1 type II CAAX endopeptidase family protein [Nitrososphaerota archaeon]
MLSEVNVRRKRTIRFVTLTFALTYCLNLGMALAFDFKLPVEARTSMMTMMLVPAFSAIVLKMFFEKDSDIYFRTFREKTRLFFYYFLLYFAVFLILSIMSWISPQYVGLADTLTFVMTSLGLLILVTLRFVMGGDAFRRAGLSFGSPKYYLMFGSLLVLLYGGMAWLNCNLGLGTQVRLEDLLAYPSVGTSEIIGALILMGVQLIIISPFVMLPVTFGEEYGWRGYLQTELTGIVGKVKAALLVGLIWGVWHAPVIAMGHNYPGYPIEGMLLMIAYTVTLSVIFGLAFIKSGSVWLASYVHGVNNQSASFFYTLYCMPTHPILSFGIGLYGIAIFAIVAALLLKSKAWR